MKITTCAGERVTAQLNVVFQNPNSNPFQDAKIAIPYFQAAQSSGNWKDLMIAYLFAGVDAGSEFPAWCSYLEEMGTADPQYIIAIATERLMALTTDKGIRTITHTGGNRLDLTPGGSGGGPDTIDSRCPPT